MKIKISASVSLKINTFLSSNLLPNNTPMLEPGRKRYPLSILVLCSVGKSCTYTETGFLIANGHYCSELTTVQ
jgi:hypothetical protein